MEFILGTVFGSVSAAALMMILSRFRPAREIEDWTEEAYNKPRAITRVHSGNLDWEIK